MCSKILTSKSTAPSSGNFFLFADLDEDFWSFFIWIFLFQDFNLVYYSEIKWSILQCSKIKFAEVCCSGAKFGVVQYSAVK